MTRYVAYVRISSEDQVGNFSLDAQQRTIEKWVADQNGTLIHTYVDEGYSGLTSDRPAFTQMRHDARQGKFDAVVVHKFDRFARNYTDALALKSLFRHDFDVKLYSVTELSEDTDSAMGGYIEGVIELIVDWYSKNLSRETAKGKKERAMQGYHNNRAPFGMDKDENGILIANQHELEGLLEGFQLYATGNHSDNDIARQLNETGYRSKTGRRFSKDTMRDILQNRTYLGYVKYQPYKKNADGSRSYKSEIQWFEGLHDAIIPQSLFDKCQEMRAMRRTNTTANSKQAVFLLADLIYCADCALNKPDDVFDDSFGKMRCEGKHYRCRAYQLGYSCSQTTVKANKIELKVINILKNAEFSEDISKGLVAILTQKLEEQLLNQRVEEIKTLIQRMQIDSGDTPVSDQQAYLQKRLDLQNEIEKLNPVTRDNLERATNIVEDFTSYWDKTSNRDEQKQLLNLIIERLWIKGNDVTAILLRSNHYLQIS